MVVIDAHSKWPEIFAMENTTAEKTVGTLRSVFAPAAWDLLTGLYQTMVHSSNLILSGSLQLRTVLRWLEIVFIFPRLVLQILFQIQFGLSYQCEIYHSNK